MQPLLLVFEDSNYTPLLRFVWRLCLDIAPELACHRRHLYPQPAGGDGGFQPFLEKDWPIIANKGIKHSGPIMRLLCVIDLDKPTKSLGIHSPPAVPENTDEWTDKARGEFEEKLRSWNSVDDSEVHGEALRWNSESLLLAACFDRIQEPDVASALMIAGPIDDSHKQGFEKYLTQECRLGGDPCDPRTREEEFVHLWRKPGACLDAVIQQFGAAKLAKARTDVRRNAVINACTKQKSDRDRIAARVPDLKRMAERIVRLLNP